MKGYIQRLLKTELGFEIPVKESPKITSRKEMKISNEAASALMRKKLEKEGSFNFVSSALFSSTFFFDLKAIPSSNIADEITSAMNDAYPNSWDNALFTVNNTEPENNSTADASTENFKRSVTVMDLILLSSLLLILDLFSPPTDIVIFTYY